MRKVFGLFLAPLALACLHPLHGFAGDDRCTGKNPGDVVALKNNNFGVCNGIRTLFSTDPEVNRDIKDSSTLNTKTADLESAFTGQRLPKTPEAVKALKEMKKIADRMCERKHCERILVVNPDNADPLDVQSDYETANDLNRKSLDLMRMVNDPNLNRTIEETALIREMKTIIDGFYVRITEKTEPPPAHPPQSRASPSAAFFVALFTTLCFFPMLNAEQSRAAGENK